MEIIKYNFRHSMGKCVTWYRLKEPNLLCLVERSIAAFFVVVFLVFLFSVINQGLFLLSDRPDAPTLSINPSAGTLMSGSTVVLTCDSLSTAASILYTFLQNNNEIRPAGAEKVFTMDGVDSADSSGTYTCLITINQVDSPTSNSQTISVVGEFGVM